MHYCQAEINIPPKVTLQREFFLGSLFYLKLLTDFLKVCIINSLSTMKYGQNNKKNVKMYLTSFSFKSHGHMFISLKVISVLQKKRNRRHEKEEKKKKVITQLLEACVSLTISSAS